MSVFRELLNRHLISEQGGEKMNFEITPDGDLLNLDAIRKIEVQKKTVVIHYINGLTERFPLDGAWRKFLQKLSSDR